MNKTLWIYWEQGFENAPEIVTKCVRSWQYHNRDFKIVLLDKRNLENYIDVERPMQAIQAWSDIVRINLLKEYGVCVIFDHDLITFGQGLADVDTVVCCAESVICS